MAVVQIATGKVNLFKDIPSDNSYYPTWTGDGKQILFTTRPHEVWDLVVINSDGTNFHVLKSGVQNEVTRYSPIWAPDGQSVFCQDRIGRTHVKTRHTQKSHMPSSAKKKKE